MTEKVKKADDLFFFFFFSPVKLFRGLLKWKFSPEKRLKSCREKFGKSDFTPGKKSGKVTSPREKIGKSDLASPEKFPCYATEWDMKSNK